MIEKTKAFLARFGLHSKVLIVGVFSIIFLILIIATVRTRVSQENQTNTVNPVQPTLTPRPLIPGKDYVQGEINVRFKDGLSDFQINNSLAKYNARIRSTISGINVKVVTVPIGQETAIRDSLEKEGLVKYAELDYKARVQFTPNDPGFANQWGLSNTGQNIEGMKGTANADIHAQSAWDVTKGAGVKVAVLDSGLDVNHTEFSGKLAAQKIFATSSIYDQLSHGTHTTGIVGAIANNGQGVAGTCPECKLLIGKVTDDTGTAQYSDIASGIEWAADNGANVISMSIAGQSSSQVLEDAVNYAWGKNVVIVAAAGNCGDNNYSANGCSFVNPQEYPAAINHVISVGATDSNDQHWSLSNYGTWVNVAAPGFHIYSTFPTYAVNGPTDFDNPDNNHKVTLNYGFDSGTSMAAPMVSGVAALIWSTPYGTSNQAVVDRLFSTADKISGTGTDWQYGRVDAAAAVASSSANLTPTVTSGITANPTNPVQPTSTTGPTGSVPSFVCAGSPNSICNPTTTVGPNPTNNINPTVTQGLELTGGPTVEPSISPTGGVQPCLTPQNQNFVQQILDWVKSIRKSIMDYINSILGRSQQPRPAPPKITPPCVNNGGSGGGGNGGSGGSGGGGGNGSSGGGNTTAQ